MSADYLSNINILIEEIIRNFSAFHKPSSNDHVHRVELSNQLDINSTFVIFPNLPQIPPFELKGEAGKAG
jgi:hypothetical protein